MEKLFTPEQAAKYLNVTRRTIYQWISEGELPATKVGRGWRIKESDLQNKASGKNLELTLQQAIEQTATKMEALAESIKQKQAESPSDPLHHYQQGQIDTLLEWAGVLRSHLKGEKDLK